MDNTEAIRILKQMREFGEDDPRNCEGTEALSMAISALESQGTKNTYMNENNEVRLIDANALKKRIYDENAPWFHKWMNVLYVVDRIDEQPTADVQKIRHGHWIFKQRTKLEPTGHAAVEEGTNQAFVLKEHKTQYIPYCSECGERGDCKEDATNYCPNCGAIMDGKTEEV